MRGSMWLDWKVAVLGVCTAVAAWAAAGISPEPLYAPGALTDARRAELTRTLPDAFARAELALAGCRSAHARVFAGAADTVQAVRSAARLEMAERLCGTIRKALAAGGTDGLCRAEVMVAELATFDRYFAEEFAAWMTYPLAPGVVALKLNVRDFGAKGDGVTDDVPAFAAAFAAVRAKGGAPSILEIPEGTYLLLGKGADFMPHLVAVNLSNCVVRGAAPEKTRIVYGRYDGDGIDFKGGFNSTLCDVQVCWKDTPFVQGTVEAVDVKDGSLVLRHQAGTLPPDDPRFGRAGHPNSCVQFDVEKRPIRVPVLWYDYRCENLGGGRYRMHFAPEYGSTKAMPVKPGATFVFPDRNNRIGALRARGSRFFTFENVWVLNSRAGAFVPGLSPWVTLHRCRIFPRAKDLALSTNADGFYCPNGAAILDCDFTNMNDDGCNSHGRGQLLLSATPANDGVVHTPFWLSLKPGDLLQAIRSMDGRYLGNLRLKSYGTRWTGTRTLQTTTFEEPLPPDLSTYASLEIPEYTPLERRAIALGTKKAAKYPDQLHAPLALGTGFVCRGNRFANLRGVAIQIQCPSSLIESNTVDSVYRGIELSGLLHYQEGPPPYNVVIRGNAIRHANVGIKSAFMTANLPPAVTAPITDILLADNRLEDVAAPFPLANMSDVVLAGNTLDGRAVTTNDLRLVTCTNVVVMTVRAL